MRNVRNRYSALLLAFVAVLATVSMPRVAGATSVSLVASDPTLLPGASETLTVQLTATEAFSLSSSSFMLTYDTTRFFLGFLDFGSLSPSGTASFDNSTGIATGNFTYGPAAITAGETAVLIDFQLKARPDAVFGPGALDLQFANLNGGSIALDPASMRGSDPTDAVVTVIGPTGVPEPSSLALCGIAGLGLGLACRRRQQFAG